MAGTKAGGWSPRFDSPGSISLSWQTPWNKVFTKKVLNPLPINLQLILHQPQGHPICSWYYINHRVIQSAVDITSTTGSSNLQLILHQPQRHPICSWYYINHRVIQQSPGISSKLQQFSQISSIWQPPIPLRSSYPSLNLLKLQKLIWIMNSMCFSSGRHLTF